VPGPADPAKVKPELAGERIVAFAVLGKPRADPEKQPVTGVFAGPATSKPSEIATVFKAPSDRKV
jgi:hypothetical protein